MKLSKYIIASQRNSEVALFDSRTGATLFMSDADYQAILNTIADKPCTHNVQLMETMEALGFFVSESANEIEDQEAFFRAAQQDCSTLRMCLAPTYACNLNCHYCYEKGIKEQAQKMTVPVMDATLEFIEQLYDLYQFHALEIEWYGGDPSLALDCVEYLSKRMIAFCNEHDVQYSAFMLSNCTCIQSNAAKMLKNAYIDRVLVTLDGPHEEHNNRRPRLDGTDSYESSCQAISHLLDAGINVDVQSNVDKVGADWFAQLSAEMQDRFGIVPHAVKLNDYYKTFGCGTFCAPEFDLFSHEEFAHYDFEQFKASGPSVEQVRARLMPAPLFCSGQKESSFVVDAVGDVFKCDGRMGKKDYKICNVQDENLDLSICNLNTAPIYPFNDEECVECNLLPLCWGNCEWERECCGHPCHPLRYTLDDYLWLLYEREGADAKIA